MSKYIGSFHNYFCPTCQMPYRTLTNVVDEQICIPEAKNNAISNCVKFKIGDQNRILCIPHQTNVSWKFFIDENNPDEGAAYSISYENDKTNEARAEHEAWHETSDKVNQLRRLLEVLDRIENTNSTFKQAASK